MDFNGHKMRRTRYDTHEHRMHSRFIFVQGPDQKMKIRFMYKTDPQICLNSSCEMDLPHATAYVKCVLSVFSQNSFGSLHNI